MNGAILNSSQRGRLRVIKLVLWALGRGFGVCAKLDAQVKREVARWPEGMTVVLRVPAGACLYLQKQGERLIVLKNAARDGIPQTEPELLLEIAFKSIEVAFAVMTGQIGVWQANAQHRFSLKGDVFFAMSVVRCMDIIENYLFPSVMSRRIIRKRPNKSVSSLRIYMGVLTGC